MNGKRRGAKDYTDLYTRPLLTELECLENLDKRSFVVVAQAGLLLEVICAEIVAAVDDIVRAFAEFEQRVGQVRENPACVLVSRPLRQMCQVMLCLEKKVEDLTVVLQPLRRVVAIRQQVEITEQIYRRARGYRSNLDAVIPEARRQAAAAGSQQRMQIARDIAGWNPQVAGIRRAIYNARNLVAENLVLVALFRPQHLLDRILK